VRPEASNATSYSPSGNSSLMSVVISFPKISYTLKGTNPPLPSPPGRGDCGIVNFIFVDGLNGFGKFWLRVKF